MSFFSTTADFTHRTLIPATLSRDAAIAPFRDPVFLIKLDQDYVSHEIDTAAWPDVDAQPADKTTKLIVTVNVSVLPKAIWSGSSLTYRAGLTQLENGVRWRVLSSLGVDQFAEWTIEPAAAEDVKGEGGSADGRYVLVEKSHIKASRLLMGTVKSRMESDRKVTHGRITTEAQRLQDSKAPPST